MTTSRNQRADGHVLEYLPAYVNKTLDDPAALSVRAHLERCAGCRAELTDWNAIALAAGHTATFAPVPVAPMLARTWLSLSQNLEVHLDQPILATPIGFPRNDPAERDASQRWRGFLTAGVLAAALLVLAILIDRSRDDEPPTIPAAASLATASAENTVVPRHTVTPDRFVPTHRSNPDLQVNLRPAPTVDNDPIAVLAVATPLQYLGEQETDADGRLWLKFRTEDGQTGWLREGTFEPFTGSEPAVTLKPPIQVKPVAVREPTDCTVAPRPVDVATFDGEQPRVAAFLERRPTGSEVERILADLADAGQEAVDGVAESVRLLVACQATAFTYDQDAGNPIDLNGRYFAVFADDAFRRMGAPLSEIWIPSGASPLTIESVKGLPDGRVVALIQDDEWGGWGGRLVVFTHERSLWRVDEWQQIQAEGAESRPPLYVPPQILRVVFLQGGTHLYLTPSQSGFRAGRDVQVVVTNLDDRRHRLWIDETEIDVRLESGERTVVTVTLDAGVYRVQTDAGEPFGLPNPNREGQPEVPWTDRLRIFDDGTPIAAG